MKRLAIPLIVVAVAFLSNVASGQEAAGIPEEIIKELDFCVGTWRFEGKTGDKELTGRWTGRWAYTKDKKKICLIAESTFVIDGVTVNWVGLMGWNAAKKCIEDRGFNASGGSQVISYKVISPGKWQGEVVAVENGREVRSKQDLIRKGPSEAVIESKSETGQEVIWVLRRIQAEGKQKTNQ